MLLDDIVGAKKLDLHKAITKKQNLKESWWSGGVNWKNDRTGLGSVGATIDCKHFFFMFPDQFLNLCPGFSYGDNKFFRDYVASKNPIGIPFLWCSIDNKNKIIKVFDHEGRHRVKAIRDYATSKGKAQPDIPVAIIYNKDKYSLPTDINDLRKNWKIISQDGKTAYNVGQFRVQNNLDDSKIGVSNLYENKEKLNEQIVYAGSGVQYDKPSLNAFGSNMGDSIHGYGLYYSKNPKIAKKYRNISDGTQWLYNGEPFLENIDEYTDGDLFWSEYEPETQLKLLNANTPKKLVSILIEDLVETINDWKKYDIKTSGLEKFLKILQNIDLSKLTKKDEGMEIIVDVPNDEYLLSESNFNSQSSYIKQCLINMVKSENMNFKELKNYLPHSLSYAVEGPIYQYVMEFLSKKKRWEISNGDENIKYQKLASELLYKYGVKGIRYTGHNDGRAVVIFNPSDIKVINRKGKNINESIDVNVYHGSPNVFKNFDKTKLGTSTKKFEDGDYSSTGYGFFFTNDKKYASGYGKNIYKCNIKLNNPLVVDISEYIATDKVLTKFLQQAKDENKDGIVFKNIREIGRNPSTEYVVFNPDNIKILNTLTESKLNDAFREKFDNSKNVDIRDEVVDVYGEEVYKELALIRDDKVVGCISYSVYNDKPYIQMIKVAKDERRKGYATQMVKELQKRFPNTEISFGMTTDDGTKFYNNLPKKVIKNYTYTKKLNKANELKKWLDDFSNKINKDNFSEEDSEYIRKNTDEWQKKHSEYKDLTNWLKTHKKEKILIKEKINESSKLNNNFRKWFGNSKVVDKNGKPLVVYHGSQSKNIKEFDPSHGFNIDAIYFTNKLSVASHWSGDWLVKQNTKIEETEDVNKLLKILNKFIKAKIVNFDGYYRLETKDGGVEASSPLGEKIDDRYYQKTDGTKTDLVKELQNMIENYSFKSVNSGNYPCYLSIQNPLEVYACRKPYWKIEFMGKEVNTETIADWAKEHGFDGVIIYDVYETDYENQLCNDYIVFDSRQIKSIENGGRWDGSSQNIYETIIHANSDGNKLTDIILKNPTRKELEENNITNARCMEDDEGNWYFCDLFNNLHYEIENLLRDNVGFPYFDGNDSYGISYYDAKANEFWYNSNEMMPEEKCVAQYYESPYLSKTFPNAYIRSNPYGENEEEEYDEEEYDDEEIELNESVGKNYLYHGTKLDVLFQILKDNMLEGSESTSGGGYCPYGVSTSRSLNFAYNFAENSMHLNGDTFEENQKIAVIVLDKDKLKQNHKIITFHDNEAFSLFLGYYPELLEKEEIVMGDIKNIKNYIVGIFVSPDCKELNTPEKLFMYYYKYWTAFDDMTKEELDMFIGDNKDIINTIMNAKVYVPNRSEYNLRNNINEELVYADKDSNGNLENEIYKNPTKADLKKYNLNQTRIVINLPKGDFYFCEATNLIHDDIIDRIGTGENWYLFYDLKKNTFYTRDEDVHENVYGDNELQKILNKDFKDWLLSFPYIKNTFGTDFNAYVFSYEYGDDPFGISLEELNENVNLKYANRIAGFYFVKDKKWELLPRTDENVWETDYEKAIKYSHNSDSDWLEEVGAIRFSLEEKENEPNTIRCIIESPKQKWVIPFIKLLEKKYPEEMSYITDYFVEYIKHDGTGATKYVKGNVFSF